MDTKLKAKWVKALRSGKYAQTIQSLKDADGYCCLGVLREISPDIKQHRNDLGLLSPATCGITKPRQEMLARMNDSLMSFPAIADYIEANL